MLWNDLKVPLVIFLIVALIVGLVPLALTDDIEAALAPHNSGNRIPLSGTGGAAVGIGNDAARWL